MSKTVQSFLGGFLIIAIIAVIVSKNSTTPSVLQSFGAMLTNIMAAIVAPISTGAATQAANAASGSSNVIGSATGGGATAPVTPTAPSGTTVNGANTSTNSAPGAAN